VLRNLEQGEDLVRAKQPVPLDDIPTVECARCGKGEGSGEQILQPACGPMLNRVQSNANRLRYLCPALILLSIQTAQICCCGGQIVYEINPR